MAEPELMQRGGLQQPSTWRTESVFIVRVAAFAAAYVACAAIGRFAATPGGPFVNFWLPSGLFVGVLLLSEGRRWPWLIAAGCAANMTFDLLNGQRALTAVFFAAGNCLEACVGAWLVRRHLGRRPDISFAREVLAFVGLAVLTAPLVSAAIGTWTIRCVIGVDVTFATAALWWSGDLLGVLLLAPVLLAWRPLRSWFGGWRDRVRMSEAGGLILASLACAAFVFTSALHVNFSLKYLLVPFLLMAAFRFGTLGATLMSLPLAVLSSWLLARGWHASDSLGGGVDREAIAFQLFFAVTMLVVILFAAMLAEQRRAAQRLAESLERLHRSNQVTTAVLDHTHMMAVYLDERFNFIWVNRAYADTCHRDPSFFPGKNHFTLYPHEENQAIFQRVVDTGQPHFVAAKPFVFPDQPERGTTYWDWGLVPIKDSAGKTTGLVFTLVEVTKRVLAEEERREMQSQLIQAQKMESIGRLAGGVAHDFNNMLSVILGRTEMALRQAPAGGPLHRDLKEIETAARQSAELARQLLAFARKQTAAPEVLCLNDAVDRVVPMLRRLIGENISLVWTPDGERGTVRIDPAQVQQVLTNLVVNARDAISGNGRIAIETGNATLDESYCARHPGAVAGEYVVLSVGDNGCGMDKTVMDHLFEPFFTGKGAGRGTGLGLATVYGIVKQNAGYIDVISSPGQGSLFKVFLPRHSGDLRAAAQPDSAWSGSPARGAGEMVLLVEDEPALLKVGSIMLRELGYTVLTASAPEAALQMVQAHTGPIHLVVTDVIMPGMNGRDLADRILALKPSCRCLFTSGYTDDVIAHHGVLNEGVRFLQKPYSKHELAAKVRAALDMG